MSCIMCMVHVVILINCICFRGFGAKARLVCLKRERASGPWEHDLCVWGVGPDTLLYLHLMYKQGLYHPQLNASLHL